MKYLLLSNEIFNEIRRDLEWNRSHIEWKCISFICGSSGDFFMAAATITSMQLAATSGQTSWMKYVRSVRLEQVRTPFSKVPQRPELWTGTDNLSPNGNQNRNRTVSSVLAVQSEPSVWDWTSAMLMKVRNLKPMIDTMMTERTRRV